MNFKTASAIGLTAILLTATFIQVGFVAAATGSNPITSPITFPGTTPTPVPTPPVTFPTPTQTPAPTPAPTVAPTPIPAPATLGNTKIGAIVDTSDANYLTGSRFQTGSQVSTVNSMSVYVSNVDSAPHNQYQMAIYTASGANPNTLVAVSQVGTLTANSWNSLPITATLQPNTKYFLIYNTNGTTVNSNNMTMDTGNSNFAGAYSVSQVNFGTWPQNFGSAFSGNWNWSIYLNY